MADTSIIHALNSYQHLKMSSNYVTNIQEAERIPFKALPWLFKNTAIKVKYGERLYQDTLQDMPREVHATTFTKQHGEQTYNETTQIQIHYIATNTQDKPIIDEIINKIPSDPQNSVFRDLPLEALFQPKSTQYYKVVVHDVKSERVRVHDARYENLNIIKITIFTNAAEQHWFVKFIGSVILRLLTTKYYKNTPELNIPNTRIEPGCELIAKAIENNDLSVLNTAFEILLNSEEITQEANTMQAATRIAMMVDERKRQVERKVQEQREAINTYYKSLTQAQDSYADTIKILNDLQTDNITDKIIAAFTKFKKNITIKDQYSNKLTIKITTPATNVDTTMEQRTFTARYNNDFKQYRNQFNDYAYIKYACFVKETHNLMVTQHFTMDFKTNVIQTNPREFYTTSKLTCYGLANLHLAKYACYGGYASEIAKNSNYENIETLLAYLITTAASINLGDSTVQHDYNTLLYRIDNDMGMAIKLQNKETGDIITFNQLKKELIEGGLV